ncbi:hypothetical protein G6F32_016021 [Rhizopus arrhizus]|nr:hypothetical protein G6F32_016021 [Rhizopus arrhizus]
MEGSGLTSTTVKGAGWNEITMHDGAGGELGQFIAQHAAARVGCVVGFPQVAAARGDVAVGVQVFARLGLGVAHGRADHGPALSQLGIGQVHVGGIATGHAQNGSTWASGMASIGASWRGPGWAATVTRSR